MTPYRKTRDLNTIQINLAASTPSLEALQLHLSSEFPQICAISDPPSHIKPSDFPNHELVPGQQLASKAPLLICRNMKYRLLGPPSNRVTTALVSTQIGPIAVISFYIQPHTAEGLQDLESHLHNARKHSPRLLLMGDGNGHSPLWGPQPNNKQGDLIENLISAVGIEVINSPTSLPTFQPRNGNPPSWLDLTMGSSQVVSRVIRWEVAPDIVPHSDHAAIITTLALRTAPIRRTKPDWKHTNWIKFAQSLTRALPRRPRLSDLPGQEAIDEQVLGLQKAIQQAISENVPKKTVSSYSKPWFSPQVKEAYHEMKKAAKESRSLGSQESFKRFKETRQNFQSIAREAKRTAFREFIADSSTTNMWRKFRQLANPASGPQGIPPLLHNDKWIDQPKEQLQILAQTFFPGLPRNPSDKIREATVECSSKNLLQRSPPPTISQEELRLAISAGRPKSAPGPDGIPYACLQQTVDIITPYLLPILNRSLQIGYFPRIWKAGLTLCIPKPGKPAHLPTSFRPITLINSIAKAYERIILKRLQKYLGDTKFHHHSQHGFLPARSTDTALWTLYRDAHAAFKKRTQIALLSLDISNAFDRAPHQIILHELQKAKAPAYLSAIVKSFLSERSYTIKTPEAALTTTPTAGTPQGSVLSPYLFTALMNTLPSYLPTGISTLIYADDVLLYTPVANKDSCPELLQKAADAAYRWSEDMNLPFNLQKCHLLRLSRLTRSPAISVKISEHQITEEPVIPYLGMQIDSRLTNTKHLQTTVASCMRRLNGLNQMSHKQDGASPEIISRLFQACIIPSIMHAAPVWSHILDTNKTALSRINRIYSYGARMCLGLYRTTAVDTAIALAGFRPPNLEAQARLIRLKPKLDKLKIQDSLRDLPTTHYSPADHLQYLLRMLSRPRSTTRRTRILCRTTPPPPSPRQNKTSTGQSNPTSITKNTKPGPPQITAGLYTPSDSPQYVGVTGTRAWIEVQ